MIKINEKILSWCNKPENEAIEQAINISKHPCLIGNVCLMPDTHAGYGMPIGGVVAFDNAVCPNMVGVDIGCGMLAVKTSLTNVSKDKLATLTEAIRNRIPVGFKHHQTPQESPIFEWADWLVTEICSRELASAKHQLGTLGGGNHFIEIQQGDDGFIWFMIHSGSRNLGYKVAKHYDLIARQLCHLWNHRDVIKNDLAFLPKDTAEFEQYMREMSLCLDFALENRQHMSNVIKEEFKNHFDDISFLSEINIHHNYVAQEHHYYKDVFVHRKGATLARENTIGIIPGSQGSSSYIVKGKGNPASLCSCSHGAGRKMSRTKAKETLSLEKEQEILNLQGIIHNLNSADSLDEATSAYKDIDVVMQEQSDLVEILVKLTPLAVIKG